MNSEIFLIPTILDEEAVNTIPAYILENILCCEVIFAEDERTARRYFKKLEKSVVIENFEWFSISKNNDTHETSFRQKIREGKKIGIVSEAGCPGVADPGQSLVAIAHEMNATVHPLVGPSSLLLALMASGMNGQQFEFIGYLPIENNERTKAIKELETDSLKRNSTKIFIETPYRNNQLLDAILQTCMPQTRLCLASNLTSPAEKIKTGTIEWWKKNKPDLHKQPCIFLLHSGNRSK